MEENSAHFSAIPEVKAKGGSKILLISTIIFALLVLIGGGLYVYLLQQPSSMQPIGPVMSIPSVTPPASTPSSDDASVFTDAGTTELECRDAEKYIQRLGQIPARCEPGCCPWAPGPQCRAPRAPDPDGTVYCKPKANPCSDGTCWECRFNDGLRMIRYVNGQWISCSPPTGTPVPVKKCESPKQCLPLDQCQSPPSASVDTQCDAPLYCCDQKVKETPIEPSPTISCTEPIIELEVTCQQCDGDVSTQQ